MRFLGRKQRKINVTAKTNAIPGSLHPFDYARSFARALHPNEQRPLARDADFGREMEVGRLVLRREAEASLYAGATATMTATAESQQQEELFSEDNRFSHEWGIDSATPEMKGFGSSGEVSEMAREAHLEAAKYHLEAASKHLAAVERYNEGDAEGAEKHSHDAWVASQFADNKSTEAHKQATMAAREKLV